MATLEIQAEEVNVKKNGSGVVVTLEGYEPKDLYASMESDDAQEFLGAVPANEYADAAGAENIYSNLTDAQKGDLIDSIDTYEVIKRVGAGGLIETLDASTIVKYAGIGTLLDEIGEDACIKHFGIKVAE